MHNNQNNEDEHIRNEETVDNKIIIILFDLILSIKKEETFKSHFLSK